MDAIGLIPAAGKGNRLHPFRYPKELFPIGYAAGSPDSDIRLKVVCEYALDGLAEAGVRRAYVIISDNKCEVLRFLSDGKEYGVELAYLHQREVVGLPTALDCATMWVRGQISALVLPDTIVEPRTAVRDLLLFREESEAEVVLGLFPTNHPEDLCPVEYDEGLRVIALHDKVRGCSIPNTWGLAVWTPAFMSLLHEVLRTGLPAGRELSLSEVFAHAMASGLRVMALPISGGRFWDIGKNSSLINARCEFERLDQLPVDLVEAPALTH
jgi:glucose-1-phosphate thymidylyltransferase